MAMAAHVLCGTLAFAIITACPNRLAEVCAETEPLGLSTLIKNIELDAFQLPCP